ncbi:MAG: altronate dehydratase family protein [Promicromonosporaceae bacterium]|nr:altronate dehydratase family protein [Promicromonosporaceae bacterium]
MSDILILLPGDDVGVVTKQTGDIPRGHKIALRAVAAGQPVHKYGQSIGVATTDIAPGDHVHSHNLAFAEGALDYAYATEHHELTVPDGPRPTFWGYRRADGRVGTRNLVAVLTSVNCSATSAKAIAAQFTPEVLAQYPNVDGVVPVTHSSGCGLVPTSLGGRILLRTLRGVAAHPNVSGLLVVGLGCEMVSAQQLDTRAGEAVMVGMPTIGKPAKPKPAILADIPADTNIESLNIQETGGTRATIAAGVAAVHRLLAAVNNRRREECDVRELVLGLNCGGSDGYSGITANPALGWASDRLVVYGATSVLAETPEVFGAEHLLTRRAVTVEVGEKLVERIEWWKSYVAAGEGSLDNNPSPGNKAGGLTTILEKSLGAVAKGGQADLAAVYEYADPIVPHAGFTFMDTPGYDPVSVTGLVAGGCNLVVFTTGRGSVFGSAIAPTIKVATNTEMYEAMHEDMDLNAGVIVDGTATLEQVGAEMLAKILAVASGQRSVSEQIGVGFEEFIPWHIGAVT